MFRLVKEKSTILKYLQEWFHVRAGIERFFFAVLSIFIFCHITACIWYLISTFNDGDTWLAMMIANNKLPSDPANFDVIIALR